MSKNEPENPQDSVERLFFTILGSMTKLLIKNNVTLPAAVEILKRAFVGAAMNEAEATDSRISLKTGVHRKDVKRLRAEIADGIAGKSPLRGLAIVLATWCNDAPFAGPNGLGRTLPRKGSPDHPGFDDLVRASKIDLAAATVLQELQDQSLVQVETDGSIALLSPTFVAQTGTAALDAFAATVTDHVRIASENVLAPPGARRQFDQVLRYSHLSADSVQTLEAQAKDLAMEYLERLNAIAHVLQQQDAADPETAKGRFVSGAFVAANAPDQTIQTDVPPSRPKKDNTP